MSMHLENNPLHHTEKLKAQMRQLIGHLRADVGKITEPTAQALFETAALVLTGLVNDFDDYERQHEPAGRSAAPQSR